jgi:serine/threonine protein kinase/tetratricopeptide (TPR) repeat protein
MDPTLWESLKEPFEEALTLATADRIAFVARVRASDPRVAAELELLLAQHEAAGRFLECESDDTQATFAAGESIADRYRVARQLGRGGMGEVYEVLDTHLNETIALKTLRQDFSADQLSVQRLVRELQVARKVTHANVCRVYDIGWHVRDHTQIAFITMEMLPGETLAFLLRRDGPLSLDTSLSILRQIANGIDAAHACGIVHRDLKPANIMLTPDERVVITDFGVARRHRQSQIGTATRESKIFGTLPYMSPEQIAGGPVTPASDIYSLGVIAHEMISGVRPTDSQPGEVPSPPLAWRSAIDRALAVKPSYRYQTASEFVKALSAHPPAKHNRRVFLIASSVCAGTAAIAIARRVLLPPAILSVRGAGLYLAPIDSSVRDSQLLSIAGLLRMQMQQSPRVQYLDDQRVVHRLTLFGKTVKDLDEESVVRRLCWEENVPFILFTTVANDHQTYVVTLRLVHIGSTPNDTLETWKEVFTSSSTARVFDAVADASSWMRQHIGESAPEIGRNDPRPEEATTGSWEALMALFEAERLGPTEALHAQQLLALALDRDPNFVLAQMRMADIQIGLRNEVQGFAAWKRTQEMLEENSKSGRRLNQKEEFRIRGMLAEDTGDFQRSEALFADWASKYPYDVAPRIYRSTSLRYLGHIDEAIEVLTAARKDFPRISFAATHLAEANLLAGRLDEVPELVNAARQLTLDGYAELIEGKYWCVKQDLSKAAAFFGNALQGPERYRSLAHSFLACSQAERGLYSAALQSLTVGVDFDRKKGYYGAEADKHVAMAYLLFRVGKQKEGFDQIMKALDAQQDPDRIQTAGIVLARNGMLVPAEKLVKDLDEYPEWPVIERAKSRVSGEIALARSDLPMATKYFSKADKLESINFTRDYLPKLSAAAGDSEAAISQYRRILDHEGVYWWNANRDFPGLMADTLWEMTKLMAASKNSDTQEFLARYWKRREEADSIVPELTQARKLRT